MVEKHEYGGRILEISDESKANNELKDVVKRAILEFFHRHALAYKLKELHIVLSDEGERSKTIMRPGSYNLKDGKIYIYLKSMDLLICFMDVSITLGESRLFKRVIEVLAHEVAHAIGYQVYKIERFAPIISARLKQKVGEITSTLKRIKDDRSLSGLFLTILLIIRMIPNDLLDKIRDEGMGTFIQKYAGGEVHFNETEFLNSYQPAIEGIKKFLDMYNTLRLEFRLLLGEKHSMFRMFSRKKHTAQINEILSNIMGAESYDIGFHIVYTLIFYAEDEIDDMYEHILSLYRDSHIEFINKYEIIMLKKRMRPIISRTSKAGYMDYSELLKEFVVLVNEIRNMR